MLAQLRDDNCKPSRRHLAARVKHSAHLDDPRKTRSSSKKVSCCMAFQQSPHTGNYLSGKMIRSRKARTE
eukprot:4217274-Amphidinium_carterae.1